MIGALIVHGETRPVREMPILWRAEPSAEYEEYVRSFVAPNPVARLYIYNVAKTEGTVCYDHVSLRKGPPDRAIITQLHLSEIDRPVSPPVEHRHIDWASPLAGGPVKTFATIRNFRCMRQFVELEQRLDLDCDVVHTGYHGDEAVSVTGRRAMQRIKGGITVHAFIRDHRRCEDTDRVRFDFDRPSHLYDVRAQRYLGSVSTVETTLPPGDTALYACLPYRVESLVVTAPRAARPGDELPIRAQIEADTATPGDHVFHVELVGPDGKRRWHYARNELAPAGKLSFAVPLALDESPGEWTVRVRDVLNGAAGAAKVSVAAP